MALPVKRAAKLIEVASAEELAVSDLKICRAGIDEVRIISLLEVDVAEKDVCVPSLDDRRAQVLRELCLRG